MKKLAVVIAVLSVALVSQPRLAPAGDDKKNNYYPLKEGNQWSYKVTREGKKGGEKTALGETTFKVAKVRDVDGKKRAEIHNLSQDGKKLASEELANTKNGLLRYQVNELKLSEPLKLLKYPVEKGEWEQDIQVGEKKAKFKIKIEAEEEMVKVPSGEYDAVKMILTMEFEKGKTAATVTYWFAPDVGMVKQTFVIGSGEPITLELTKFEKG